MSIYNILIEQIPKIDVNELYVFNKTIYTRSEHIGLASNLRSNSCNIPLDCGKLHLMNLKQLAERIRSDNILEAAIGLSAINSFINSPELIKESVKINAFKLAEKIGEGNNISVIGSFPNAHKMKNSKKFKNVWIFELYSQNGKFLTPDDFEEYLPRSQVVLITATTLINHTFNNILKYIDNSYNIMVGPSTPLNKILFENKIDVLSGTVVKDPKTAKLFLSQGASYRIAEELEFISIMKEKI